MFRSAVYISTFSSSPSHNGAIGYVRNCLLLAFFSIPSVAPAQYGPYQPFTAGSSSQNNNYAPYPNDQPSVEHGHYSLDHLAPQAVGTTENIHTGTPEYAWQQPAHSSNFQRLPPRDSAFVPSHAADYSSAATASYHRPEDAPRPTANDASAPTAVYSSSPANLPSSAAPTSSNSNTPNNLAPLPDPADETANDSFDLDAEDLDDGTIWYQPSTWLDSEWDKTIALGLNGSGGNSDTLSLRAGGKIERDTDRHKFLFEIVHNRAESGGVSTQDNVLSKTRFDRKLAESRWSLFAQGTGEYDEFKAFDLRLAGNVGVNYKFIATDTTTLAGDFGSGASREFGGPDNSYVPEAAFGLDFKHQLSKRQKVYVKSDYFPDWGDFHSYRVVTDTGWELLLDAAWNLNLKIGVIDRYDSTPNGRRPNDIDYSVLLLWKL